MHLRKQSDESSDASEQSGDEAAPGQARPCDAVVLKRYKSSLDGKFHTITLPSSGGEQKKQAVAFALAPMMSDYKFAWYVHNFALCFSATTSARAHIGGGALVSWLVHVLVTGKNVSNSFYAQRIRQDRQCCARESRAVLSRRHWGICSNIKVID